MSEQITFSEYWDEVASLAKQISEEARDDDRDPDEVLHETIDGHQWVIYTTYNFDVLRHSDNDGAYVEDFGAEGVVQDGQINWSALAFCALERDVREHSDFEELEDEDE